MSNEKTFPEMLGIPKEKSAEIIKKINDMVVTVTKKDQQVKELVSLYEGPELHFALYAMGMRIGVKSISGQ